MDDFGMRCWVAWDASSCRALTRRHVDDGLRKDPSGDGCEELSSPTASVLLLLLLCCLLQHGTADLHMLNVC